MVTWLIIGIFLLMSVLMFTKKLSAMFALPIMAFLIAIVAGIPWGDTVVGDTTKLGIANLLFTAGPTRLASAIMMLIFGAILAQFVKNTGIAETMIRKVSELAGDRPLVLAISFIFVIALLFTTLGGLGAVIMVGSIVLPIMISVGIKPFIAGCILLISFGTGVTFNLANWGLYMTVLGLTVEEIRSFAFVIGGLLVIMAIAFAIIEIKLGGKLFGKGKVAWAVPVVNSDTPSPVVKKANILALLTPLVPLVLVMVFEFGIVAAFVIGILYGLVTTVSKDSMKILAKSVIQGISDAAAPLFLMVGIGMLLLVVMDPRVTQHIGPAVAAIMPSTPFAYMLFFTVLAPFALYRGPLNLWGLGLGIGALMMTAGILHPMAIMAALLSVERIQAICDPTNTHNVWTSAAVDTDVNDILKKTLPYVWVTATIGLIVAGSMYV